MIVRTRFLVASLAAVALFALVFGPVSGQTTDKCDFNGDGAVSDDERKRCESQSATPSPTRSYEKCDFNQDGAISPEEKERCEGSTSSMPAPSREGCDANEDGTVDDAEKSQCYGYEYCDANRDGRIDESEKANCQVYDPCDFNKDGAVDAMEKERCYGGTPCDFNGDGKVDEAEKMECGRSQPCDFNRDGRVDEAEKSKCAGERDPCDYDQNGYVDESERANCAQYHPCDFDQDGAVTEAERSECVKYEPCDFNKDGVVDEKEKYGCGYRESTTVSAECRAALSELEAKRKEFYASIDARRTEFESQMRARYEEFAKSEHTDEDWQAFKADLEKARMVFESEMRGLVDRFEMNFEEVAACQGQGSASIEGGADCSPSEDSYVRFKVLMEEREKGLSAEMDARILKFREYQDWARRDFEASSPAPTGEERKAFEEKLAAERARFEQELESDRQRVRAELEKMWIEFKTQYATSCMGTTPPTDVKEFQEESMRERFACELAVQASVKAFLEANGEDTSTWTADQTSAYMALKVKLSLLLRECEERLHQAWKEKAGQRFDDQARSERMGHFEMTPTGENSADVKGRFVSFSVESGSIILRQYSVAGLLVMDKFWAPHTIDEADVRVDGAQIQARGTYTSPDGEVGTLMLHIHDGPEGGFAAECDAAADNGTAVRGDPRACRLTFPETAKVEGAVEDSMSSRETKKYDIGLGEQEAVLFVHGPHAWTGMTLEVYRSVKLHLASDNYVFDEFANKDRDKVRAAIGNGRVLAEIDVVGGPGGPKWDAREYGKLKSDGQDENVGVRVAATDSGKGVKIRFSAEAETGRTLVINLESGLFAGADLGSLGPDSFDVVLYSVAGDGTRSRVDLRSADSVDDVLDPSEAWHEWWLVLDRNGLQLLVSVAHFSDWDLDVEPKSASSDTGVPGPGAFALVALLVATVLGLALRRRRA